MWDDFVDVITYAVACGITATLTMDIWAFIQKKIWSTPSLDYCLVGRWVMGISKGQITHVNIVKSNEKKYECHIGWLSHYAIGILFSGMYLYANKLFLFKLSIFTIIGFGLLTVLIPFFIMQPCFGFGLAASKTPKPWLIRSRSLVAHFSFGIGLCVSLHLFGFLRG